MRPLILSTSFHQSSIRHIIKSVLTSCIFLFWVLLSTHDINGQGLLSIAEFTFGTSDEFIFEIANTGDQPFFLGDVVVSDGTTDIFIEDLIPICGPTITIPPDERSTFATFDLDIAPAGGELAVVQIGPFGSLNDYLFFGDHVPNQFFVNEAEQLDIFTGPGLPAIPQGQSFNRFDLSRPGTIDSYLLAGWTPCEPPATVPDLNPGDLNFDGQVDAQDFVCWNAQSSNPALTGHINNATGPVIGALFASPDDLFFSPGDFNGDFNVDAADLDGLFQNSPVAIAIPLASTGQGEVNNLLENTTLPDPLTPIQDFISQLDITRDNQNLNIEFGTPVAVISDCLIPGEIDINLGPDQGIFIDGEVCLNPPINDVGNLIKVVNSSGPITGAFSFYFDGSDVEFHPSGDVGEVKIISVQTDKDGLVIAPVAAANMEVIDVAIDDFEIFDVPLSKTEIELLFGNMESNANGEIKIGDPTYIRANCPNAGDIFSDRIEFCIDVGEWKNLEYKVEGSNGNARAVVSVLDDIFFDISFFDVDPGEDFSFSPGTTFPITSSFLDDLDPGQVTNWKVFSVAGDLLDELELDFFEGSTLTDFFENPSDNIKTSVLKLDDFRSGIADMEIFADGFESGDVSSWSTGPLNDPVTKGTSSRKKNMEECVETGFTLVEVLWENREGPFATMFALDETGVILQKADVSTEEQIIGFDVSGFPSSFSVIGLISADEPDDYIIGANFMELQAASVSCTFASNQLTYEFMDVCCFPPQPGTITDTTQEESTFNFDVVEKEGEIVTPDLTFEVEGQGGSNHLWVLTDGNKLVQSSFDSPPVFDYVNLDEGSYVIEHWSSDEAFGNIEDCTPLDEINACYAASNPATIQKIIVHGGTITVNGGSEVCICNEQGFTTEKSEDATGKWVLTDTSGIIAGSFLTAPDNLNDFAEGDCFNVYWIDFYGILENCSPGVHVDSLKGCFDKSNAISIKRKKVQNGILSFADGSEHRTSFTNKTVPFEIILEENLGTGSLFTVSDEGGIILWTGADPPGAEEISSLGEGNYQIGHISFENEFSADVGGMVDQSDPCVAVSNQLTVYIRSLLAGSPSTSDGQTDLVLCVDDGNPDLLSFIASGSADNTFDGDPRTCHFVVTDPQSNILANFTSEWDFEGGSEGLCYVYGVQTTESDLSSFSTLDELKNSCTDVSDSFVMIDRRAGGNCCMAPVIVEENLKRGRLRLSWARDENIHTYKLRIWTSAYRYRDYTFTNKSNRLTLAGYPGQPFSYQMTVYCESGTTDATERIRTNIPLDDPQKSRFGLSAEGEPTINLREITGKMEVFPNPVVNDLKIRYGSEKETRVVVYSVTGQIVTSVILSKDTDIHKISLEMVNSGFFFVSLEEGRHPIFSKKILVSK